MSAKQTIPEGLRIAKKIHGNRQTTCDWTYIYEVYRVCSGKGWCADKRGVFTGLMNTLKHWFHFLADCEKNRIRPPYHNTHFCTLTQKATIKTA